MPNNFHKRPQADADLDSIWSYIALDNVGAANHLSSGSVEYSRCLSKIRWQAARPDLQRGLRSFPVGSYLVFYVPVSDGIEIVRVMSGRQDIDADDMI